MPLVVTPGAKPILLYAALTLIATGDEVRARWAPTAAATPPRQEVVA